MPTEWEWEKAARGVNPNEGYDCYPEFLADCKLLSEASAKDVLGHPWLDLHLALQAQFKAKWMDPWNIIPIGTRPFDLSPYGCFDMIFNAPEWTMGTPRLLWDPLTPLSFGRTSARVGASDTQLQLHE